MAQAFSIDPKVERHFIVTDLLCGIAICQGCKCEPVYTSEAPELSDKHRYDQAVAMQAAGWVVLADNISLLCPECGARRFGAI